MFRIKGNITNFLPGKLLRQGFHARIGKNARAMIDEALKCFYGASYIGSVAMCRAAVIEQILGKGIGDRKDHMPTLIEGAKKAGIMDTTDESHAATAGLIAREALHHMGKVTEDDAMIAMRSAVRLVNNMAGR